MIILATISYSYDALKTHGTLDFGKAFLIFAAIVTLLWLKIKQKGKETSKKEKQ